MGMLVLGVVLIIYGAFCALVGIAKAPAAVWNMGKIQGFRSSLGDLGTQIFLSVWGTAALGFGIFFIARYAAQ